MSTAALNASWQFHADREPGTKKALTLSLVAHLLLLALLTLGISWKSSSPAGVEVELWNTSVPVSTNTPTPTLELKQEAADIAVKKTKVNPENTKEAPKKVESKPEKKVEVKPPEKKIDPKEDAAAKKAAAAAEKARADQLARLKAAAGAEGGSGGKVGDGVGAGGNAPPGYADKVRKKIKPLIIFNAETVSGNPAVVVLLDLAPDGMILKRTVITASSDPAWDRAVLLAIERAESLPRDENGKIPMRQIKLTFKPKD
ncbi:TonB C terminal [Burkholderiaceae bacterium]